MGKIQLKSYTYPARNPDYRSGDLLKKIRQNQELARVRQSWGLVTHGIIEATQVTGGYGWAVSEYIDFPYVYTRRPSFSGGMDGTIQLPDGFDWNGENTPSDTLPAVITEELTSDNYQPAIFVPRVIHWNMQNSAYVGCYILVCQVNSECTETDKTVRIHYRFEGRGYQK